LKGTFPKKLHFWGYFGISQQFFFITNMEAFLMGGRDVGVNQYIGIYLPGDTVARPYFDMRQGL
jgi:hypothetical protein